jgi:hypothetical protein
VKATAVGRKNFSWDVVTENGIKVEVKDSELHQGMWVVNLRGMQHDADFIAVSLRGLTGHRGFAQRVWVVLPKGVITRGTKLLRWSLRKIINTYSKYIAAWDQVVDAERRRVMAKLQDLTGLKFGRLTVESRADNDKNGHSLWWCVCSCDGAMLPKPVEGSNLKSGNSASCGCWCREQNAITKTIHGQAKRGEKSPEYLSWSSMRERAGNRDGHHPTYTFVNVCDRWLDFNNFLADMGEKPQGTSLSRFADTGDYAPSNCAWHTDAQQKAEAKKKKLALLATSAQPQMMETFV